MSPPNSQAAFDDDERGPINPYVYTPMEYQLFSGTARRLEMRHYALVRFYIQY